MEFELQNMHVKKIKHLYIKPKMNNIKNYIRFFGEVFKLKFK